MFTANIVIPYRPNVSAISSWANPEEQKPEREDTLNRCLFYLRKNSEFQHNFIIVIDSDISIDFVQSSIKDMDRVKIIQSNYLLPEFTKDYSNSTKQKMRINHAFVAAHNSIPDEEWVCYSFISDVIPCRGWDKYLIEQIQKRGENYAYVPMFVEIFPRYVNGIFVKGEEITHNKIWNVWRKNICCHALTLPEPKERNFIIEDDFENFCSIARGSFNNIDRHEAYRNETPNIEYHLDDEIIIEDANLRIHGYLACYFIKNKYVKFALNSTSSFSEDWAFYVDNKLPVKKVVVTNSFVFHPWCDFKVD